MGRDGVNYASSIVSASSPLTLHSHAWLLLSYHA